VIASEARNATPSMTLKTPHMSMSMYTSLVTTPPPNALCALALANENVFDKRQNAASVVL